MKRGEGARDGTYCSFFVFFAGNFELHVKKEREGGAWETGAFMQPAKRARTLMAGEDPLFVKRAFCGPVTALCWVPDAGVDVLLSGRGTDVLVARVTGLQQQQLGAMRLFVNGRVHGIKGRVGVGGASTSQPARLLVAAHSEKNVTVAELAIHAAGSPGIRALSSGSRVLARLWQLDDWCVTLLPVQSVPIA